MTADMKVKIRSIFFGGFFLKSKSWGKGKHALASFEVFKPYISQSTRRNKIKCMFVCAYLSSLENVYLFLLNKTPLFEESDPELKWGGVINTCLLNSENFDFLPKNQQKNGKNFLAASPRIFPKKVGGIEQENFFY